MPQQSAKQCSRRRSTGRSTAPASRAGTPFIGDFIDQALQKFQQQAQKARGKGGGTAADNSVFLQGKRKEVTERGAVPCIIAETNHEEEHKDWEAIQAMIEAARATFSTADTSAFLQGKWKEVMERGAVRCIIAETVPNHEEEHNDWEAEIEAARQRARNKEVPPPSSEPTNHWDRLPDELQETIILMAWIIMRMDPLVIKGQIFVTNLDGCSVTMSEVLSAPVWVFKEQIAAKTGVPPADQRLIFGGRQLENRHPLTKYGIYKETTVRMWPCAQ